MRCLRSWVKKNNFLIYSRIKTLRTWSPVIKRSHPEKQCLLPPAGTNLVKFKCRNSPGLLFASGAGDVLFTKI